VSRSILPSSWVLGIAFGFIVCSLTVRPILASAPLSTCHNVLLPGLDIRAQYETERKTGKQLTNAAKLAFLVEDEDLEQLHVKRRSFMYRLTSHAVQLLGSTKACLT